MTSVDELHATIEQHMHSCEAFRRITFSLIVLIITIFGSIIGFMVSEQYITKGRQDVVINRQDIMDRNIIGNRDDTTSRLTAVVNANTQREATFNERFKSVDMQLSDIRKQIYELDKATWKGRQ